MRGSFEATGIPKSLIYTLKRLEGDSIHEKKIVVMLRPAASDY